MPKIEKKTVLLLPVLAVAAGVCRGLLYRLGMDEKGLLVSGHICEILVWLASCAALAVLLLLLPGFSGSNRCEEAFGRGKFHALAGFLVSAAVGFTAVTELPEHPALLDWMTMAMGILAVAGAAGAGWCRSRGKRPNFLFHSVLCVYLALRSVSCYRVWSANPQLMDYFFSLMAGIFLMLTAYHHAAFDAGMGSRKLLVAFSWAGIFCCTVSISTGGAEAVLYAMLLFWSLVNLPGERKEKADASA